MANNNNLEQVPTNKNLNYFGTTNNNSTEQAPTNRNSKYFNTTLKQQLPIPSSNYYGNDHVQAPVEFNYNNRDVAIKSNKYNKFNDKSYAQPSLNPMEVIASMMGGVMIKKEDKVPDYKEQNRLINSALAEIGSSIQKIILNNPNFDKTKIITMVVRIVEDTDPYKVNCELGSTCPKLFTKAGCDCHHSKEDMALRQHVINAQKQAKVKGKNVVVEKDESFEL